MIIEINKSDVLDIFIKEFKSFLGSKFNDDSCLEIANGIYNRFINDPCFKYTNEGIYWWGIMVNNINLHYSGDSTKGGWSISIREDKK